jgi:hypothetical protein
LFDGNVLIAKLDASDSRLRRLHRARKLGLSNPFNLPEMLDEVSDFFPSPTIVSYAKHSIYAMGHVDNFHIMKNKKTATKQTTRARSKVAKSNS